MFRKLAFAVVATACALLTGCGGGPPRSFADTAAPPAPDYADPAAWLAFPGRQGRERSAPEGVTWVAEALAPADVFFIHPTTTTVRDVWNAPWDSADANATLNPAVQMGQISAFNACCRLYAPHYRQATLLALSEMGAIDLAYGDVAAAFRTFIAQHNDGRPFIVAAHSQGVMHAIRLLQEEVLRGPLKDRLVVAYLIGGYVPDDFGQVGLPVCDGARQTGCVISWNTGKIGNRASRLVIHDKTYWWHGAWKDRDQATAVCVNPLTWRAGDTETATPAAQNPGSIGLPRPPFPNGAATLQRMDVGLTEARCHGGMLEVSLPDSAGGAYGDNLTRLFGSYHLNDYGLFYASLRANAAERVQHFMETRNGR